MLPTAPKNVEAQRELRDIAKDLDDEATRSKAKASEGNVTDYRRGIELKETQMVWQKLWHFHEGCEQYPTRGFAVRQDRPSDDDLCAQCNSKGS
jgi:hypothetical protein